MFSRSVRFLSSSSSALKRTQLYDFHVSKGAKMVPFAGYSMPLTYGDVGQLASHLHVRKSVGLFDVGHMMQTIFRGPGALSYLETLVPSSLAALKPYTSTLSVLLNERGGIVDDTIITKHDKDSFYVVTNAARSVEDMAFFNAHLSKWNGPSVELEVLENWGLLALQGPEAARVLQELTSFDLRTLTFGTSAYVSLEGGFNLHVARGGYTGEDGFEISVPPSQTTDLAETLSKQPSVQLAGLAARDSLRIEAGMCLYGQDIDENTTPVEAGLSWLIAKEKTGYSGEEKVREHLNNGPPRRRVGFIVEEAPARQGARIFSSQTGTEIGNITSGIPSPSLGKNIAMGYVLDGQHKRGTELEVELRGKRRKAVVTKMPFVKTGYWRG